MSPVDYFETAVELARKRADAVFAQAQASSAMNVRVRETVELHGRRVPFNECTYSRCDADLESDGALTIRSIDDGHVVREYLAGDWAEVIVLAVTEDDVTRRWSAIAAGVR
jgi:hypothetical protein